MGGTGLAYRLDGANSAVNVAVDKGKDEIPVSADGNPFYPGRIAWYDAGSVELTAGKHVITWYLGGLKEKDRYGGMDCFVLTTGDFTPNGKYKPGEKSPQPTPAFQPGQAWDFVPAADKLDPSALLDLRYLNEKAAGEHGFVRLSPDGNSFLRGDGRPIRFWAASSASAPQFDLASQKHSAQFLAKRGVNLMRLGDNSLIPTAPGSKITDVNEKVARRDLQGRCRHEVGRHLLDDHPLLGLPGEDPEELGSDRPRRRQSPRAVVLRADDAERVQGVAEVALWAEEPLYRPDAGRGPVSGHYRATERG